MESELFQFALMSNLHVGDVMMIKNYPCKITEKNISKTGKHGASKAHVVGKDIFTDKKYEEIFGSSEKIQVPIIVHISYIVQFVEQKFNDDNTFNVFVLENNKSRDLPIEVNKNNEQDMLILERVNKILDNDENCILHVIQSMNKERITQCSQSKNI